MTTARLSFLATLAACCSAPLLLSACSDDKARVSSAPDTVEASTVAEPASFSGTPAVCVLNAGTATGLGSRVEKAMIAAGFTVVEPAANMSTSAIVENTVLYAPGNKAAAEAVAAEVPGGAVVAARQTGFTRCGAALAVVVFND